MAEDTSTEDVCSKCSGTGWVLVVEDGTELVKRCECAEAERRRRLLAEARIPARYRHCTLAGFEIWDEANGTLERSRTLVQEFVDLYPEVERGLLLMGPVGSGKPHLAVAALTSLILDKGVRGRFADFTSLVLEIQMTFGGSGSSRDILAPLISTELLVLDELGAGKATQWVMDLLYYLVNTRYLEKRFTIFTTNFTDIPKESEESLGDRVSARIRSRLFEMCRRVEFSKLTRDYRRQRLAHERERDGR